MGKSPEGLFSPKHCVGEQAAWVGWAPSRSQSEPMSEVQRTNIGWTLNLQVGVVGGCENEERARCLMQGSQLAGNEIADEKKLPAPPPDSLLHRLTSGKSHAATAQTTSCVGDVPLHLLIPERRREAPKRGGEGAIHHTVDKQKYTVLPSKVSWSCHINFSFNP